MTSILILISPCALRSKVLDLVNDGAVIAVVLSFVALVALGAPKAHLDYLLAQVSRRGRRG